MLLPCRACVRQQLHVWLQLECVCGLISVCVFARWNGMHVYRVAERGRVAACRDDGIGKRSLSLRPTAKPAGGATAIYSLSPSLPPPVYLARSPALFFRLNPFFFFASSLRSVSLSSLSSPLVIFSPLSPLRAPTVLMFSHHVSYPSCFLCLRLSSCCFLFFLMLRGSSLFSHH